jgi:purine-binding chemotaxis protein CheW
MSELLEHQFLTLTLAGERYALPVDRVREVLEPTRVTKIPCSAPYLKGIIDIRGSGVPVMDLRLRFTMPETIIGKDTAIIVVESMDRGEQKMVGLLTDAVHEVIQLDSSHLESAPRLGSGLSVDYIEGIGRQDGLFVFILNLDRILNDEDMERVEEDIEVSALGA